jgi:Domain of unknown function (DUF397)
MEELEWRKSTRSGDSGNCVEVANVPGGVLVRDSKNPHGAVLNLSAQEWAAFLDACISGEFDLR